jgi:hypothetical protein
MCRLGCFAVLLILLLPAGLCAQNDNYFCEEPAHVRAFMMELPSVPPGPARQAGVKPLVAKYPGDFWVQRTYIDAMREYGGAVGDDVVAQFKKRFDAMPGDPEAAYLYAYALYQKETPKAAEILSAVARQTPGLPIAWLTLAAIYRSPAWSDFEKVRFYWEGYVDRCPHSADSEAAPIALQLEKSDRLAVFARNLRQQIAGRADARSISLFRVLWPLEAKIALPQDLPMLRKRVAEDVQFLEGLDKRTFPRLASILAGGYRIIGNRPALERVSGQTTPVAADQSAAFNQAYQAWRSANGDLAPGMKPSIRKSYYLKQLQFLDLWMPVVPDDRFFSSLRFTALAETVERASSQLVFEGDRLLEISRAQRNTTGLATDCIEVARAWAYHGLELERIPALVKETLDAQERAFTPPPGMSVSDLLSDASMSPQRETRRWAFRGALWPALVTASVKSGNVREASGVLVEWEAALQQRRDQAEQIRARRAAEKPGTAPSRTPPAPLTSRDWEDSLVSGLPAAEARYYESFAELALSEGRKSDALKSYQTALQVEYGGKLSFAGFDRLDLVEKAQRLWADLDRAPAAWRAWLQSISVPTPNARAVPR